MDEKQLAKAKDAALKFLSYGMKTEKQVEDKLKEKDFAFIFRRRKCRKSGRRNFLIGARI